MCKKLPDLLDEAAIKNQDITLRDNEFFLLRQAVIEAESNMPHESFDKARLEIIRNYLRDITEQ